MTMINVFQKFLQDDSGATAIEYGLLAALLAVGIIGGARAFATDLNDLFSGVDSELVKAFGGP